MPSKNALFNLVNSLLSSDLRDLPQGINLEAKHHQTGTNYIFCTIPFMKGVWINELELIHHHVSIVATARGFIDLKSQYHYTAYFRDKQGTEYRLHVYFDHADKLVFKPLLSKVTAPNTYHPVSCEDEKELFEIQAKIAMQPLIQYLRDEQERLLSELQRQLDGLELQASQLSENLAANKKGYLEVLSQQLDKISEFLLYTPDPRPKLSIKHFLKHMHSLVLKMLDLTEQKPKVMHVEARTNPVFSHPPIGKKQNRTAPDPKKVTPLIAKKSIEDSIKEIQLRNLPTAINALYSEMKQLEYDVYLGGRIASPHELKQLKIIMTNLEREGSKKLLSYLIREDFEAASGLSRFHSLVQKSIINLALSQNKPKLLDYLLTHKIATLDYKHFKIGEQIYASLLDYCFNENNPQRSNLELLKVLLRHGASLLHINHLSNLPFAVLLRQPNHPLGSVINDTEFKLFNDPLFNRTLQHMLRVLISQPDCSEERKIELQVVLNSTSEQLNSMKLHENLGNAPQLRKIESELTELARELVGDEIINNLLADRDILALKAQLNFRATELLKLFSKPQQASIRRSIEASFEQDKKFLEDIKKTEIDSFPDFEELRATTIKQILDSFHLIDVFEQLIHIQKEMQKKSISFNGREPKRMKQLREQQRVLSNELKRLNAHIDIKELNALEDSQNVTMDELKEMEKMFDWLKSHSGMLFDALYKLDPQDDNDFEDTKPDNQLTM